MSRGRREPTHGLNPWTAQPDAVQLPGSCGVTELEGDSDCAEGERGAWCVGEAINTTEALAAACVARCQQCARCNYVSYSLRWRDCSWFFRCPRLLHRVRGFSSERATPLAPGTTSNAVVATAVAVAAPATTAAAPPATTAASTLPAADTHAAPKAAAKAAKAAKLRVSKGKRGKRKGRAPSSLPAGRRRRAPPPG